MADAGRPMTGYLRYLNPFDPEVTPWMTTAGIVTATAASAAIYVLYRRNQQQKNNHNNNLSGTDSNNSIRAQHTKKMPLRNRVGAPSKECLSCIGGCVGDRPVARAKAPMNPTGQIMLNLEHGGQVVIDPSLSQWPGAGYQDLHLPLA